MIWRLFAGIENGLEFVTIPTRSNSANYLLSANRGHGRGRDRGHGNDRRDRGNDRRGHGPCNNGHRGRDHHASRCRNRTKCEPRSSSAVARSSDRASGHTPGGCSSRGLRWHPAASTPPFPPETGTICRPRLARAASRQKSRARRRLRRLLFSFHILPTLIVCSSCSSSILRPYLIKMRALFSELLQKSKEL